MKGERWEEREETENHLENKEDTVIGAASQMYSFSLGQWIFSVQILLARYRTDTLIVVRVFISYDNLYARDLFF